MLVQQSAYCQVESTASVAYAAFYGSINERVGPATKPFFDTA